MERNNLRLTVARRAQSGAAGGVVVLLALAFLVWWQWDWIAGFFGGGSGGAVELVDYRCDKQSDGRGRFDGVVRNASEAPIELRAVTAIYDSSGKRSDYREATVRPVPIPPGKTGDFRGDTAPLPDGGYCKLDKLVDSVTGKPVSYSGRR